MTRASLGACSCAARTSRYHVEDFVLKIKFFGHHPRREFWNFLKDLDRATGHARGCVTTYRQRARVQNQGFDQLGYLFCLPSEGTATDNASRMARRFHRSTGSEAEIAHLFIRALCKHPSGACAGQPFGPRATVSGFVCSASELRAAELARRGVAHVGSKRLAKLHSLRVGIQCFL